MIKLPGLVPRHAEGWASTSQAVDTAAGRSIRAKKAEGKKAARRGDADEAWRRMGMRTLKKAVRGTGNVTPLAGTLLGWADISFTGHHYQSRPDGKTTVIAETGHVSDEVLTQLGTGALQR